MDLFLLLIDLLDEVQPALDDAIILQIELDRHCLLVKCRGLSYDGMVLPIIDSHTMMLVMADTDQVLPPMGEC